MAEQDAPTVINAPKSDLRERRRLATAGEINDAALHLFETQGVDSTTVADIARAAGVSARTFFRYFDTKEMAALIDLGYADLIDTWAESDDKVPDAFDAMLEMLREALESLDRSEARDHLLRMRRLIRTEYAIRVASMRSNAEHTARIERALTSRSATLSDTETSVLSRVAGALVDAAVEEWEALIDQGHHADLGKIFQRSIDTVRSAMTPSTSKQGPGGSSATGAQSHLPEPVFANVKRPPARTASTISTAAVRGSGQPCV